MRRVLLVAASFIWLAGCAAAPKFGSLDGPVADPTASPAIGAASLTTPTVPAHASTVGVAGSDPFDDLSLGKKYFRASDYGLAEQHYRKAVEAHPNDAEAWVGLASSYDRLKRFDLADRAYKQALRIDGPTAAILNDQGFSYMMRGNYVRARKLLRQAHAKDPKNPYIRNNLRLLEVVARNHKGVG